MKKDHKKDYSKWEYKVEKKRFYSDEDIEKAKKFHEKEIERIQKSIEKGNLKGEHVLNDMKK